MKSVFPRAGLALLCAVILSACGGSGGGSLQLAGSISGLVRPGLVLINKSTGEKLPVSSGTTLFVFTRFLSTDEQFEVDIDTQPTGTTCKATQNKDKASVYTSSRVIITCNLNPWTLGGTVTGLADDGVASTNDGVTLANGPDTVYIPPPAAGAEAKFAFADTVGEGSPYGVTVLAQPTNRTCTVTAPVTNGVAGAGLMPASNYSLLIVACVPK
ncbi:MAG TPA: hypothetical protein VN089_01115 [Duganella sp.]|nr:hypothetical protein [Duganella sp.]